MQTVRIRPCESKVSEPQSRVKSVEVMPRLRPRGPGRL